MAIQLEANYSKKLGLPGYSSHQYSITIRTELGDLKQVESESSRLYALLQSCVDRDIQESGFLPANANGNGSSTNGHNTNGNGSNGHGESWSCTEKQKALILKVINDHHLDKHDIESLAQDRFGKGVKALNKMEASGLIEELLETHGGNNGSHGSNGNRTNGSRFQKARSA